LVRDQFSKIFDFVILKRIVSFLLAVLTHKNRRAAIRQRGIGDAELAATMARQTFAHLPTLEKR
jgi:hypothetical protein